MHARKRISEVAVMSSEPAKPSAEIPQSNPVAGVPASRASGSEEGESEQPVVPDSKYAANGRRDPFLSPVVSRAGGGSGCSTGKKCLEIGTINLRGVVHCESGFIAVVSNGLNKAYFLRENDPVFNGYVVKITGDSIVFQETLQDRLGKSFTREVVKKITTPAV
jgi:Tfp pilus assembly protein PilP